MIGETDVDDAIKIASHKVGTKACNNGISIRSDGSSSNTTALEKDDSVLDQPHDDSGRNNLRNDAVLADDKDAMMICKKMVDTKLQKNMACIQKTTTINDCCCTCTRMVDAISHKSNK
jgi:hypothetical protein